MNANGVWHGLMDPVKAGCKIAPDTPADTAADPLIRILIIGAGQRGVAYAKAIQQIPHAAITAVADLVPFKLADFGAKYVRDWPQQLPGSRFNDWREFVAYETSRRARHAAGAPVPPGVDAAFVCTLDEQHADIITGLAPLGLHVMSEKPLATTLQDCLRIYASLLHDGQPRSLFGIGHVLRYSPHNMLLRSLLLEQRVIGDVLSVEHTEPVGWWHFSHSYVRGNWRRESTTAPSLLTKSCHDIDLLLWLLASPVDATTREPPHWPKDVSSTGHLSAFRRSRKPKEAGAATNCLSCAHEPDCRYSAKRIYVDKHLRQGKVSWPVNVIDPAIEDLYLKSSSPGEAETRLLTKLSEDYDAVTPREAVHSQRWYGRCVWESDNDVCDDQVVTLAWDDDPLDGFPASARLAKTATFHMIAHTEAQCERRGRIYGSRGEISYDSTVIDVVDFATGERQLHHPKRRGGGHGGGDAGLAEHFVEAVRAVKVDGMTVEAAQQRFIGCSLEDVMRSHAMVFAAEEARRSRTVVDWADWWHLHVATTLRD